MNRKPIVVLIITVLCVVLASTAAAQSDKPNAPDVAVGTTFKYQGQIKRNTTLFTGTCDMQFKLWDAAAGGTQQGTMLSTNAVPVNNGVFAVELNFGNQFKGEARWVETAAKCADDTAYTILGREPLNPTPYAIGLMPGAQMLGSIPGTAGVLRVTNNSAGAALLGLANSSTGTTYGVLGNAFSPNGYAVSGYADGGATAVFGYSNSTGAGVVGESIAFEGVRGVAHNANHGAVVGIHDGGGFGVYGLSTTQSGVVGQSTSGVGVAGESQQGEGVRGTAHNPDHAGVVGVNDGGSFGVYGQSTSSAGVVGETAVAHTFNTPGVYGRSTGDGGIGVIGEANIGNAWGVYGVSASGVGIYGATTTGFAGYFAGKVGIAGGSDLAELFDLSEQAEPGTLMIIDAKNPGHLTISTRAYDTKVAGIVSGAGDIKPGLTLHQDGVMEGDTEVAIAGRVYVRATAVNGAIEPGDLLTTSDVPGHAMKATDLDRSHGAIIGKAMTGLKDGTGLVLVLVNLQ